MRVKLLSDQTGRYVDAEGNVHEGGFLGDVVDLPDELGQDLVAREQAVEVKGKAAKE